MACTGETAFSAEATLFSVLLIAADFDIMDCAIVSAGSDTTRSLLFLFHDRLCVYVLRKMLAPTLGRYAELVARRLAATSAESIHISCLHILNVTNALNMRSRDRVQPNGCTRSLTMDCCVMPRWEKGNQSVLGKTLRKLKSERERFHTKDFVTKRCER